MLIHGGIFMCKVQDCSRVIYSLAMCNMHYQRFKKYGNPLGGTKTMLLQKKDSGGLLKNLMGVGNGLARKTTDMVLFQKVLKKMVTS